MDTDAAVTAADTAVGANAPVTIAIGVAVTTALRHISVCECVRMQTAVIP